MRRPQTDAAHKLDLIDSAVDLLCRPGTQSYRLAAEITWERPVPDPVRLIPGVGDDHWQKNVSSPFRLNCNEAGAWRFHASHSMAFTALPAAPISKGAVLGANLRETGIYQDIPPGGLPPRGTGGWAAHHTVPGGATRNEDAQEAERIAYDCGIKPNEAVNGVWLRGPVLKKGTPGYELLPTAGRRRPYHQRVHTARYYEAVRTTLERLIVGDNYCSARNASRARELLVVIRTLLADDVYPYRDSPQIPGDGD